MENAKGCAACSIVSLNENRPMTAAEGWLARRVRARAARQWRRVLSASAGHGMPLTAELRDEARDLHHVLGRVLQGGDARSAAGRDSLARLDLPAGTDWRWRPRAFCGRMAAPALIAPSDARQLSDEVTLFHDCAHRALILRQARNRRATDLADYGLALEVMGFSGRFLSFALGLPDAAREGLADHHILRLEAALQAERPIAVYARMNLRQGPNTQTMLRQMGEPVGGPLCHRVVEFDLGHAGLSARSVEAAWLDIIFEAPAMNAIGLRDAVLSRHPRAQV